MMLAHQVFHASEAFHPFPDFSGAFNGAVEMLTDVKIIDEGTSLFPRLGFLVDTFLQVGLVAGQMVTTDLTAIKLVEKSRNLGTFLDDAKDGKHVVNDDVRIMCRKTYRTNAILVRLKAVGQALHNVVQPLRIVGSKA